MSIILQRSLAALKATGAKYIIVMPDGTTHSQGDLKLETPKPEKRRKRGLEHPIGTITKYYMPFIENLQAGEIAEVPYDKFRPEVLVSGISSRAVSMWGKGSALTAQNPDKRVVEVLRIS